ncbi:hypothetical protein ACIBCO_39840 [Streptomyces violascens]|uniref:hypothetical protein n=1 Tax=Streptomyces violascens TaxID=67381 RepID=UPI0037AD61D8
MRTRAAALAVLALLTGCTAPAAKLTGPSPDDVIKAATQILTDSCLRRQHLVPPRPGQKVSATDQQRVSDALFGSGPAELSLRLPTGYVVRAHTDGCLASANQRLYGDQRRWFQTSVIVNNLQPEASHDGVPLSVVRERHRAELADWDRLRTHAVTTATSLLREEEQQQPTRGTTQP